MELRVVYEDPALLVIDKPVGLSAIPERDLREPSLQKALEAARGERLWVVHRLDKEVSGLIVFARTAAAHRALSMAFEARQVDKTYVALLVGVLADDAGVIEAPVHQFGSGRMGVDPRGKPSTTRYTVARRGPAHTLVHATPLTGRRHQLRVHFYHMGHPIAGDPRYGARAAAEAYPRLMLHAWRLVVPRPPGAAPDPDGLPTLTLEAAPDAAFEALLGLPAAPPIAPTAPR